MNKSVAVVILNYIQYINVKSGIDELIKRGYKVDVFCSEINSSDGFGQMFDDTAQLLKKEGYKVYRSLNNKKYKVLLEPYPYMEIDAIYRIRYRYGMISAKPNIVYLPKNYLMYDAVMCCGEYDSSYLKAFTNPLIVGNLKYNNFKRVKHDYKKKVLLYLPTYGSESSINSIIEQLPKLREKYHVIAKIHHGTTFLVDEKDRIEILKNNVDEFYDCFKSLSELLSFADVVLTDNSGSIFESLYVGVPVCVFCDDINANKIGEFNTTQFELYQLGILPYTNKRKDINTIVDLAISKEFSKKQKAWAKENFHYSDNAFSEFADAVELYLTDNINNRYYTFRKNFAKEYYDLMKDKQELDRLNLEYHDEILRLSEINNKNKEKIATFENTLSQYQSGKLYRIAKRINAITNRIRGIK